MTNFSDNKPGIAGPGTILCGLAVGLIVLAMAASMFTGLDRMAGTESEDWMEVYFHQAEARQSFLRDLRPPFWSPYVNGGYPLAGHPYDPSLSPLFPVTLLSGELLAPRINLLLIYLFGVAGMALLTRRTFSWSGPGTFAATALYAASGWLPAHFFLGNYNECFYFLFPLALHVLARARKDRRFVFFGGAILYLMLAEAKFIYPVVICYLFACWAMFYFSCPATGGPAAVNLRFRALVLCVAFSVLMGLLKLDLLASLLSREPRIISDYTKFLPPRSNNPVVLLYLITSWFRLRHFPADMLVDGRMYHDVDGLMLRMDNQYLGTGLLPVLFLAGAVVLSPRRFSGVLALFMLSLLLCLSSLSRLGLFDLLSGLPVFSSMKNPAKYFGYFLLFFTCIGSGGFFEAVAKRAAGRLKARAVIFIMLTMAAGMLALFPAVQNTRIIPYSFGQEIPETSPVKQFFQVDRGILYINLRQGFGIIRNWCGNIVLPSAVAPAYLYAESDKNRQGVPSGYGLYEKNPGYRGEAYLALGKGKAGLIEIKENRIIATTRLDEKAGLLVINQNYDPGWRTSKGQVTEYRGLLAVRLSGPGEYRIFLRYVPPWAYFWFYANLLALVLIVAACFSPLGLRRPFSTLFRAPAPT